MLDRRLKEQLESDLVNSLGTSQVRLVRQYLEQEYELVKEQLVEDGADLLRGEAKRLRKLIKKLTVREPVEVADPVKY